MHTIPNRQTVIVELYATEVSHRLQEGTCLVLAEFIFGTAVFRFHVKFRGTLPCGNEEWQWTFPAIYQCSSQSKLHL
jgi:creatinine amidohydrolase/Fe(II)-dependent formamide hydrolase-like protein